VSLAKIPIDNPGKGATATVDKLHVLLPPEFADVFKVDMSQYVPMTTQAQFDLSPKTVSTNILPHYASFLAGQITRGLIYYSALGVPMSLKIVIDQDFFAVAEITWGYSVVGVEVANTHTPV
jgi:hypothetical protein